jgi:hypothetical protein
MNGAIQIKDCGFNYKLSMAPMIEFLTGCISWGDDPTGSLYEVVDILIKPSPPNLTGVGFLQMCLKSYFFVASEIKIFTLAFYLRTKFRCFR